jgi:hypothetical protein
MFNSGFRSVLKSKQNQSITGPPLQGGGGGAGPGMNEFRTISNLGIEDAKSLEKAANDYKQNRQQS